MMEARILGVFVLAACLFAAGWTVKGWQVAAVQQAEDDTREKAMEGAAEAIAKIKVENRTIYAKVQKEVIEKPVYRDCAHDPETFQKINEALVPQ